MIYSSPRALGLKTWLGQVPDNWSVARFKQLFDFVGSPSEGEIPLLSLTRSGIVQRDTSSNEGQLAASYDEYPVIEPGTFVLNPMDLVGGWVARSNMRGRVSAAYFSFRLRKDAVETGHVPEFFEHVLQSYFREKIFEPFGVGLGRSESGGGRWALNRETLREFPLPVPPPEEQLRIAKHLDKEVAQIDEMLKRESELTSLLLERRVTVLDLRMRGIPDSTEGADGSRLAQGWQMMRLDNLGIKVIDCLHSTAESTTDNSKFLVVRTSCIRDGRFYPGNGYFTDEETFQRRIARARPEPGDVFLTREAPAGEACLVPRDLNTCLGQRTVLLRVPRERIHPEFVVWNLYLPHMKAYFDTETSGSMVQNLTIPRIRRLPFIVPPIALQRELLGEIQHFLDEIDYLIAKTEDVVACLNERKRTLIAHAVSRPLAVMKL